MELNESNRKCRVEKLMGQSTEKLRLIGDAGQRDTAIPHYSIRIIGPCGRNHHADLTICEESGNLYQRLRSRFFNYLRRLAE